MDRIKAAVIEVVLAAVCIALAIGVMLLMVAAR